ncbi:Fur family transcriptional regulator [Collinsella bouchesdurhonensis]|uniref:Fur family transcriptional regulator n=1 Tax=Collinsella bouchesdurhonensis TaxID=1907654 RepID=UPI0034A30023
MQRRNTKQRTLILDIVRAHGDHPTAEDIYRDVHEQNPKVSRGTVYRNLNLLEETGDIISIEVPGGNRFDRRCDPHAHVICCSCGVVCDAMVEHDHTVDGMAERQTGYIITRHETLFYGICPSCQEKKVQNEDAQASA